MNIFKELLITVFNNFYSNFANHAKIEMFRNLVLEPIPVKVNEK